MCLFNFGLKKELDIAHVMKFFGSSSVLQRMMVVFSFALTTQLLHKKCAVAQKMTFLTLWPL